MTRSELYTFFVQLNGDEQIDDTLFQAYLDIAQAYFEGIRPWMTLRKADSSETVTAGNTVDTAFDLPDDFNRWYDERRSIGLWDGTGLSYVLQVPYALARVERGIRFFVNYVTNTFGFSGTFPRSYSVYQFYIYTPPLVSATADSSWVFPVRFHKYLALAAAVFYKLGTDYDLVNNAQADQNAAMAKQLIDTAERWDDDLQEATLQGMGVNTDPGFHDRRLSPGWWDGSDPYASY